MSTHDSEKSKPATKSAKSQPAKAPAKSAKTAAPAKAAKPAKPAKPVAPAKSAKSAKSNVTQEKVSEWTLAQPAESSEKPKPTKKGSKR